MRVSNILQSLRDLQSSPPEVDFGHREGFTREVFHLAAFVSPRRSWFLCELLLFSPQLRNTGNGFVFDVNMILHIFILNIHSVERAVIASSPTLAHHWLPFSLVHFWMFRFLLQVKKVWLPLILQWRRNLWRMGRRPLQVAKKVNHPYCSLQMSIEKLIFKFFDFQFLTLVVELAIMEGNL